MQPIVDGLEEEFQGKIGFERRDAESESGQASLRAYGLRGHPSYVIVGVDGEKLWSSTGSIAKEMLQKKIMQFLQ